MEDAVSLERAIESDFRIAVIRDDASAQIMNYFKRLTLTTGRAIYDWSPENGLYRLGIEHIFIPRTRAPADLLSYVVSSRHYGIYLLRDFKDWLKVPGVERQLVKLAEKADGVRRLVVLVGDSLVLPASLQGHWTLVRSPAAAAQAYGS